MNETTFSTLPLTATTVRPLDLSIFRPQVTMDDGAKRPDNAEIAKIADDALNALKYSIANVAADLDADVAAGTIEAEFKAAVQTLDSKRQDSLQQSSKALVTANASVRQAVFGRYGAIAPKQAKDLGFSRIDTIVPSLAIDAKQLGVRPNVMRIDPSRLRMVEDGLLIPSEMFNGSFGTEAFETSLTANGTSQPDIFSEYMTDIWGPMYANDPVGSTESLEAGSVTDKLAFYINRVKCVDETNPEWWGKDEIALAGLSVDETGDTKKINERFIGSFNDGDQRHYNPDWRYTWFNMREQHNHNGAKWPKRYTMSLILAEKDHGGLQGFLNSLWGKVRDKVKAAIAKAVGGALSGWLGTAIAAAIGQAVAWIIDKLVGWLINLFGDDIFPAVALSCTVPSYSARWTINGQWGSTTSGLRRAYFSGHGGRYYVEYYWKLYS